MDKTVCELFAGVGGFRCGLNNINAIEDCKKPEKWSTVWFSQWEPGAKTQWAYGCYVDKFGKSFDIAGEETACIDIAEVNKKNIPDHNLLVGGFPCQDYSVARGLHGEKGIEGKKGVLWWSIYETVKAKEPPFILLENVDRLLKSPAKQRGRDFGIILACLRNEGYIVEWRVINAAEYGNVQRRRRTYIFAYRSETKFGKQIIKSVKKKDIESVGNLFEQKSFFARSFPVEKINIGKICFSTDLDTDIINVSDKFSFDFDNSGIMIDGIIYTVKVVPKLEKPTTLGEILESKGVDKKYYIEPQRLYYTNPSEKHSDETKVELSKEDRQTWQYIKGAKKKYRTAANGHQYVFSEGAVPMIDEWDVPARTMLTSEGSFNRSTHIVRDKETGNIRILTPVETERIQGFPDNWTRDCLINGENVQMSERMRYFCMGNALVVDLIKQMETVLNDIFNGENDA